MAPLKLMGILPWASIGSGFLPMGEKPLATKPTFCCVAELHLILARLTALVRLIGFTELNWKENIVWAVPATSDEKQLDFILRNHTECCFGAPPVTLHSSSALRFQGWLLFFPIASVTLMIPMEILALCTWAEFWDYLWKLSKCPRSALHLCS